MKKKFYKTILCFFTLHPRTLHKELRAALQAAKRRSRRRQVLSKDPETDPETSAKPNGVFHRKIGMGLVVLALLLLPFSHVNAAAFLTLNTFSGHAGTIHVSGGGWTPEETVSIYLGQVSASAAATVHVSASGSFGPIAVTVPFTTPQGPLPVIAVGSVSKNNLTNSYYVANFTAAINVANISNTPGSTVQVSGSGFASGEKVNFSMEGSSSGSATADASGSFSKTNFVIPQTPTGTHLLHAVGASSGADAVNYFYVGGFYPTVSPSSYYVLPTDTLSFSGGGFAAGETVQILEGKSQTPVSSFKADSAGSFSDAGGVVVPLNLVGTTQTFTAVGNTTKGRASVEVSVGSFLPNVFPSAFYVLPGQSVDFSGGAFAPLEAVDVFEGGVSQPVTSFTVGKDGSYKNQGSVTIPVTVKPGALTFRLRGKTSGGEANVTISIAQFNSLITPSAYHMNAGQDLTFSGTGFAPGEKIDVLEGQDTVPLASIVADKNGSFVNSGKITLPFSYADGAKNFHVVGQSSHTSADATVTVAAFQPQVGVSLYYALPGAQIFFYGGGFGKGEQIEVTQGENSTVLLTIPTDTDGAFAKSKIITIPLNAPAGKTTFHLKGVLSGATNNVVISIGSLQPQLSPSAYYLTPGQNFTISGSGFAPGEKVKIIYDNQSATVTASSTGEFAKAGPFTAPFSHTGPITVKGAGQSSGASASVELSLGGLYPQVTPSSYYVLSGGKISFVGGGFAPGEDVLVSDAGTDLFTLSADKTGSFQGLFVTTDFGGDRSVTYTFTGAKSRAVATLTITIAALIPQVSVDNYYATPGSIIHVFGSGFAAGEGVNVVAGSATAIAKADGNGSVTSTPIALPLDSNTNNLKISITGQKSAASASTAITLAPFLPQLSPSTYYASPGTGVKFWGSGFMGGEKVTANLNGANMGTVTADNTGSFVSGSIIIPATVTEGANFTFTGNTSKVTSKISIGLSPFNAQISPSTYYTLPGTAVTFWGSGFAPGESVNADFNGQGQGALTADDTGSFVTKPFTIPFGSSVANFTFTGSQSKAAAKLSVGLAALQSGIVLSTYYDAGGSPLTITGTGFGAGEKVNVTFDGQSLGAVTADTSGGFVLKTSVPFSSPGSKTIKASGASSGAAAEASLTQPQIYVNVQLGSYAGAPGSSVMFMGSGFFSGEPVEVTTDRTGGTAVASFVADAKGAFTNSSYHIPTGFIEGQLKLTITGTHSKTSTDIVYFVNGQ